MSPSIEFGIGLPIVQQVPTQAQPWEATAGPVDLVRIAQAADRLGFAWLTCSDHVAVPASYAPSMGATWYESATTLAFLAAATQRIRLLSHVLVLPYRHPLVVAKTFATLDVLSAGRVIIGTGSGHLKPEFRSLGIDHAARGPMTDEYLEALAAALEHAPSSFDGRYVHWRDMFVSPRAVQQPRPPIWVGGNSNATARRVGRHAEGWIPWQLSPADFAPRAAMARTAHAERGRSGSLVLVAPLAAGRVDDAAALHGQIDEWCAAGATAFHVGFAHRSCDDYIALLERFAGAVGGMQRAGN